ncbi:MAG: helix-turn-helix domain-containing protein [Thermoplasmata archaeon]|nr:helix-turn-helix domain-containing protein [Thermoplasmata archaeon]
MDENCTVFRTVDLIAKRWSILILLEMHRAGGGPKRFTDLKRGLRGITPKVLSGRLKELEDAGLITKKIVPGVPPRTEYGLTKPGRELMAVIGQFKQWALKWKVDNPVCEGLACPECGLRST